MKLALVALCLVVAALSWIAWVGGYQALVLALLIFVPAVVWATRSRLGPLGDDGEPYGDASALGRTSTHDRSEP